MENIEAIKRASNNFENTHTSTLLGWRQKYDNEGRPKNSNPNYRIGYVDLDGKEYWYVRKGWEVRIWNKEVNYTQWWEEIPSYLEEIDLTPEYLK